MKRKYEMLIDQVGEDYLRSRRQLVWIQRITGAMLIVALGILVGVSILAVISGSLTRDAF